MYSQKIGQHINWTAAFFVLTFLLALGAAFTVEADEFVMTNPPAPVCPQGAFLWEQTVDVTNLDANGNPIVDVRFWRYNTGGQTIFEIPGPYPASMVTGPVWVSVPDAVAWDGYTARPQSGEQTDERFKIVFLKNGVIVAETPYSGDPGDDGITPGWASDYWRGPMSGWVNLANGTDQILLIHWSDPTYGTGDTETANSVVPTSVCIDFDTTTAVTLSSNEVIPVNQTTTLALLFGALLTGVTGLILRRRVQN